MIHEVIRNIIGPDSAWFWTAAQAIGVIVTLFYIYRQVRIGQSASMLEALLQLETKWTAKRTAKARKTLCEEYRNPNTKGKRSLCPNSNAILIFFEELGLLVHLGVLDRQIVWERLSYVIEHYWQILEPRISETRAVDQDDTLYEKFQLLATDMKRIYTKKVGPHAAKTDHQLMAFAAEEIEALNHAIIDDSSNSAAG